MYKRDVKRIRFRFFARMSLRPLNETSSMPSFKQISSKSIDLYSLLLSIRKLEPVFYNSKSRCYIFQKLFTKAELCLLFKWSFLEPNCSSNLLVFSIKSISLWLQYFFLKNCGLWESQMSDDFKGWNQQKLNDLISWEIWKWVWLRERTLVYMTKLFH